MNNDNTHTTPFNLIMHGTRGTQPVAGEAHLKYGGRTTCVEVQSDKLPNGELLFLDGGTGLPHAIKTYMGGIFGGQIKTVRVLHTHHHKDHIEGVLTVPLFYMIPAETALWSYGPKPPSGRSHRDTILGQFDGDTWPKDKGELNHRLRFTTLKKFASQVFIVHPKAGFHLSDLGRLNSAEKSGQIRIQRMVVDINDCLVIRMQRVNHANSVTISYRLEDRQTGAVAVFCTDHEAHPTPPMEIKQHFKDADVLISDCAYTMAQTEATTSGWGHGVPMGVIREALAGQVKSLYLTHHDPSSSDERIDREIRGEVDEAYDHYTKKTDFLARQKLSGPSFNTSDIHMCCDGMAIEVKPRQAVALVA